jgi:AcrR family transcriptional regulator
MVCGTKERLFDAALSLFAEKGYEATSVREIIEAAGVSRPVLYYYCASKEDLFRRLVHGTHEQAHQQLAQIVTQATSCEHRLRAIVRGSFAFCVADPRVPRLMFQTAYGAPIPGISEFMTELGQARFTTICKLIQAGLNSGELRGQDAAALTLMFCCLMDQHLNILARGPAPEQRLTPTLADQLVDVFLHGVGTRSRKKDNPA